MILDHRHAELRENQFPPLPELVRYCSSPVYFVHIDVFVALVEHETEFEHDFDAHAQNSLVEVMVFGQLTSFEEPLIE